MKSKDDYIKQHFPEVEAGATPCGNQILVQYRTLKEKTAGGIVLVEDTKEFNNGTRRWQELSRSDRSHSRIAVPVRLGKKARGRRLVILLSLHAGAVSALKSLF